jgi:hypothetical protein
MSEGKKTANSRKYDVQKLSQDILDKMTDEGLSCYKACVACGVPNSTFMLWVSKDPELAERYARAREDLIERIAEETIEIADSPVGSTDSGATDSGMVQKQKLQVDTRKWLLAKLAPKKYGEKIEQTIQGAEGGPLKIELVPLA